MVKSILRNFASNLSEEESDKFSSCMMCALKPVLYCFQRDILFV